MIRVKVIKSNNKIKKITFRGHADYDVIGKDIVCAASSVTILTSINAILAINPSSISLFQKDNNIDISILEDDEIVVKLILNMLECLKSIRENYPKNIEIIEEE